MRQRILTGDRPTGPLHIGHYFGSLQNRVKLQDHYDTFVMLADVQALTDNFHQPDNVRRNVLEVALDYLAVGIDPNKAVLLIQSGIPGIAELTVFYSNLVTLSQLQQNPTVKSEIALKPHLFKTSVTYGFLGYPVSQAADITAFQADLVPVGEDQLPHIEQTRAIVRKFNHTYGLTLKEPQAKLGNFPRIKGLDGNAKMSKSLGNALYLKDPPGTIREKIMQAVTDPDKVRLRDPGHPEVCTVYSYHALFDKEHVDVIGDECRKGIRGCVACKQQLIHSVTDMTEPIRELRAGHEAKPGDVYDILQEGTTRARVVASETVARVKESMKLDYFVVGG